MAPMAVLRLMDGEGKPVRVPKAYNVCFQVRKAVNEWITEKRRKNESDQALETRLMQKHSWLREVRLRPRTSFTGLTSKALHDMRPFH